VDERGLSRRRWRRPDRAARGERVRLHRVFFALWPGAPFRDALGAVATRLLERVEGRRLGIDDWHVTVCFIGAVNEGVLAALQASAAAVAPEPFTLRFDRIEYWPEARVVAATASQVPTAAVELSSVLRELARSLGLAPDEKPLRPHLTLMRGVNPLAWQMNRDAPGARLEPELVFMPYALHLAESRPAAHRSGASNALHVAAGAPSYARLASWPLQH
jgi:RNA 2',3'-cyclic 3'-phosphodiesterase